jgi:hypothetical protein
MASSYQNSFIHQGKPYRKPRLIGLGDLRTLTLGGSAGAGDSGSSLILKPKVGLPQPMGLPLPDGSTLMPDGTIIPPGVNPNS